MYYLYRLAVLMKSSLQHCTHVSLQSHKSSFPFLFFLTQLIAIKRVCSLFLYNLLLYSLDWKNIQATLVGSERKEEESLDEQDTKRGHDEIQNRIVVKDVIKETSETLEFRNRVVEMALGFGYLVVATDSQCYIYDVHNWHTPHIFDLRYPVSLIKQCDRFFVMLNAINGVQIFNYDGRNLCNPKFSGLRVECLSDRTMSVAVDTLAILNPADRTWCPLSTHSQ